MTHTYGASEGVEFRARSYLLVYVFMMFHCDSLDTHVGGFGGRGVEGKILAAHYARTNKKPYLGICLGMQIAVGVRVGPTLLAHCCAYALRPWHKEYGVPGDLLGHAGRSGYEGLSTVFLKLLFFTQKNELMPLCIGARVEVIGLMVVGVTC